MSEWRFDLEDRLREVAQIAKATLQSRVIPSGHSFTLRRLASFRSAPGYYAETTAGLTQFHFLESLLAE